MIPRDNKKRTARRVAGLGAAALAIGALFVGVSPARPQHEQVREEVATATEPAKSPVAVASAAPRSPSSAEAEEPPIIDEVSVEKSEVCAGEENLVTVRAHTPNGTDAYLHYVVGSEQGGRVPLRAFPGPDGSWPRQYVRVFGRRNAMTQVEVPAYKIKNCTVARAAFVTSRLLPNSSAEFALDARVKELGSKEDGGARPFRPVRYTWAFGDGTTEVTTRPRVVHNYEDRPQNALVSEFLVSVEIRDEAGNDLVGRSLLQVVNPAFQNYAERGVVTIMSTPTPRYPEVGDDGTVRQKFRLWHHRDEPVTIEKVTLTRHYLETSEASPAENVDGKRALGISSIPPGKGVEISLQLGPEDEQQVSVMTYHVEGTTAEGIPVRGTFSLMRPPPKPTRENSTAVTDPTLLAKVMRTREILKKEYITAEDIADVDRDGQFADLQEPHDGNPSAQAAQANSASLRSASGQVRPATPLSRR